MGTYQANIPAAIFTRVGFWVTMLPDELRHYLTEGL